MRPFLAIVGSELRKKFRNSGELFFPALFFMICMIMFPIALGTDLFEQRGITSGAVWISAIIAVCLSLENIFVGDYKDGSIEMTLLSGINLPLYCLARATSYWLSSGMVIMLASIPMALLLGITLEETSILIMCLAIVTATISLIGSSISALTAGLRGGSLLLITLLMPLLIPPVIFGTSATSNTANGLEPVAELFFLAGFFILALTLSPLTTALAIRIRVQ